MEAEHLWCEGGFVRKRLTFQGIWLRFFRYTATSRHISVNEGEVMLGVGVEKG